MLGRVKCARFPVLLLSVVLLLGLPPPTGTWAAPPQHELVVMRTRHLLVRARAPGDIVDSLVEAGDQLVPALLEHFGQQGFRGGPPPPFRIEVHSDRAHFEAAVKGLDAKARLEGLGGYTSWTHKTAHLFLQESRFESRRIFLHELVHLVHDRLLRRGVRQRTPPWYLEGLAEHFGWHRRTRTGVHFGALDALAVKQRPLLAKRRVLGDGWDAWARVTGRTQSDYTDAVALFEGLRGSPHAGIRAAFRSWEREHIRRNFTDRELVRALRPHRASLAKALRDFWSAVHIEWTTRMREVDEDDGWIRVGAGRALAAADRPRRLPKELHTGSPPIWTIERSRPLADGGAIRWTLPAPVRGGIYWRHDGTGGAGGRELYLAILGDTLRLAPAGAAAVSPGWNAHKALSLTVRWGPEGLLLAWQQGAASGRELVLAGPAEQRAWLREARPALFMLGSAFAGGSTSLPESAPSLRIARPAADEPAGERR